MNEYNIVCHMTSESAHKLLQRVLDFLKSGEIEQAFHELSAIMQQHLDDPEVLYVLAGVEFWRSKLDQLDKRATSFEKGEFLVSQWRFFLQYMQKQGEGRDAVLYALKRCAFSIALGFYQSLYKEDGIPQDPEVYRKTGLCYKALGDYERALRLLERAKDGNMESAPILAELADCYALCGEMRFAKVLFREAFFKDPEKIELYFLESEIIRGLIRLVENMGYEENEVAEWIPVYGLLKGVFNVKRGLRALEFGKLKQNVFWLENELKTAPKDKAAVLTPRLINHYFWLIDHYANTDDDKAKINEILLKIKLLDESVYKDYTM